MPWDFDFVAFTVAKDENVTPIDQLLHWRLYISLLNEAERRESAFTKSSS